MSIFESFMDEMHKLAQVDEDRLIEFFTDHPDPTDEEFHDWAGKKGINPSKAEAIAYRMATRYSRIAKGGKSGGSEPPDLAPEELKRGIEVELEHTDDADVARKIALDHLTEFNNYYTELDKMEKRMSKAKEKALQPATPPQESRQNDTASSTEGSAPAS